MSLNLAILGATGAVGREILRCLAELNVPYERLRPLASSRSAGTVLDTPLGPTEAQEVSRESFQGMDYAIFSAGAEASRRWAPVANSLGCTVIDNSSAFRLREDVPLIVPEINGDQAFGASLIANPNCTTAIAAVAVYPLHRVFGVKRMLVSTYQSASGAGGKGIDELRTQTTNALKSAPEAD